MVTFLAFLNPAQDLCGSLESLVHSYSWKLDDGIIHSPKKISFNQSNLIPTRLLKRSNLNLMHNSIMKYKEQVAIRIGEEIEKKESDLNKINPNTKKGREVIQKLTTLRTFNENIEDLIAINGPYHRSAKRRSYHLKVPFLNQEEQKTFLSNDFQLGGFASPTRAIKYLTNFPFSIYNPNQEVQFPDLPKRISPEILQDARSLAIDFETQNWETIHVRDELSHLPVSDLKERYLSLIREYNARVDDELDLMDKRDFLFGIEKILNDNKDERITTESIINLDSDCNYLVTTLDCGKDFIDVRIPGTDKTKRIKIINTENQHDLIKKGDKIIHDFNPLFMYGHNQLKFDYKQGKKLTGVFKPGVENSEPLRVAGIPGNFIEQVILPGRIDIDPAGYSQHYMWNYNNKLDTVFLDLFGVMSKKTMTHYELSVKTHRAENGSKKDAYDILYYAAQDSMKSYMIGEKLKEEHIRFSYLFSSLPARIDTTSKKTLAQEFWNKSQFYTNYSYLYENMLSSKVPAVKPFIKKSVRFDEFKFEKFLHNKIKSHVKPKLKGKKIISKKLNSKKGMYECVAFAPFIPIESLKPIVLQTKRKCVEDFHDIYRMMNKETNPSKKIRYSKALKEILMYPFVEMLKEDKFSAKFELGFNDPIRFYSQRLENEIKEFADVFTHDNFLNFSSNFYLFKLNSKENYSLFDDSGILDNLKELEKKGLGVILGTGNGFSGSSGKFGMNLNGKLFLQGIADPNSNKGERCPFEKDIYNAFNQYIVMENDKEKFLDFLIEQINFFNEIQNPSADSLTYKRVAKRNFYEYSCNATQGYIKKMIASKTYKDDLFKYNYGVEELKKKFFGSTEVIGRKKITKKGSISELVSFAFPFRNNSKRYHSLQNIYAGVSTEQDKWIILN